VDVISGFTIPTFRCHVNICAVAGLWGQIEWHLISESIEIMKILKCALQVTDGGCKNFEFFIHFI
jgi:hypothetical protein